VWQNLIVPHDPDFSLRALYKALDAQRRKRGISWAEATRQMGGRSEKTLGLALSPSTVQATRVRRNAEGDGVLAMLGWLNRSPESFVPGYNEADDTLTRLP
jgi:hypothetical protein